MKLILFLILLITVFLYCWYLHRPVDINKYKTKYAIVTGASSGIGLHFSKYLLKLGIQIIAIDKSPSPLENVLMFVYDFSDLEAFQSKFT